MRRLRSLKRQIRLFTSILALLCAFPIVHLEAQGSGSISGKLIYIRSLSSDDEVVILSEEGRRIFRIPQSEKRCYSVSPLGDYLALSTALADELVIRSLETGDEIALYEWADNWTPCTFGFSSEQIGGLNPDTTLIIYDRTDPNSVFHLDVLTGKLNPSLPSAPIEVDEPPQHLSGEWILRSPNPDIVVYNRCLSGETSTDMGGDVTCTSAPEFDIFSFAEQRVIQTLNDMSLAFLEHPEGFPEPTAWSPAGHYLAYLTSYDLYLPSIPSLRVYDVISHRYLDTDRSEDYYINEKTGLFWSPDESRLAFWLNVEETSYPLLQLVVFNTDTATFQQYQTYDVNFGAQVFWSPDNQSLAILGSDQSLIHIELGSGSSATLDTNVQRIIVWRATGIS